MWHGGVVSFTPDFIPVGTLCHPFGAKKQTTPKYRYMPCEHLADNDGLVGHSEMADRDSDNDRNIRKIK